MSGFELEEVDNPAPCPGCGGVYPATVLARGNQARCHVCGAPSRPSASSSAGEMRTTSGLILPGRYDQDDDQDEGRPGHEHPRYGVVVAVFLGTQAIDEPCLTCKRSHTQQILAEITEGYSVGWTIESRPSYHYQLWDLTKGLSMEVKTIGHIHFDPESQDVPPFLDMVLGDPAREKGRPIGWRRIR